MKKLIVKTVVLILVLVSLSSDVLTQTRIRFARGRTSTSVSGRVGGGGARTYVLSARYGQFLSANVSSRNGCVRFSNGATSTSFTTDAGNNYLYLSNGCRGMTSYTLTVSINYGSD
jgi:hypothetical protein